MTKSGSCRTKRLIASDAYSVDYCPTCALVHLNFGPMSLRLDLESLDELVQVLSAARQAAKPDLRMVAPAASAEA